MFVMPLPPKLNKCAVAIWQNRVRTDAHQCPSHSDLATQAGRDPVTLRDTSQCVSVYV